MDKLVIFYTHAGAQEYLKTSLEFSKKNLKNCDFILLGDESNKDFCEKWESMENLKSDMSERFRKNYKHMSTNMKNYEFFCFIRWFYILEYMKRHNIKRACYMDSDILFINVPEFVLQKDYYYTGASGGLSFFTYDVLKELCEYILEHYENKDKLKKLEQQYSDYRKNNLFGGICDMTLISRFGYLNGYEDALGIRNMSTFDHHINAMDGFVFNRGAKAVFYKDGDYYFKNNQSGLYIKCNTLHFQGDAKEYMKYFVNGNFENGITYIFDYEKKQWDELEKYNIRKKKTFLMRVNQFRYKIAKRMKVRKSLKKG